MYPGVLLMPGSEKKAMCHRAKATAIDLKHDV